MTSHPKTLPFTGPWLLAPMEGVTDPCFRELVLERNSPQCLGGAFTEFVRVVDRPVPRKVFERHLGERRFEQPVGLQLMGSDLVALAESARRVEALGVPLVDLNFGCPAKGALRGCSGSAQLKDPRGLERVVRSVVDVIENIPVTAKIRAGFDNAEQVEDLARAAEQGGASLLTIHCRTKVEHYQPEVDWTRIARAVNAIQIPVCGNGGVATHAQLERMRSETGCTYVMVGQGAIADPWVFSGGQHDRPTAFGFLQAYLEVLLQRGARPRGAASRIKQLLRHWTAGEFTAEERLRWLREQDPERLIQFIQNGDAVCGTAGQ